MEPLFVADVLLDEERVSIRCEDGVIAAVGADLSPSDGDQVIEADGMLITPPMVNCHTHSAMTLFRAYGDDLPLMQWLEEMIWPAEAKLDPEDVYWGTKLATVEMLRSGTTKFYDIYWNSDQVARAAVDAGMRVAAGQAVIDQMDSAKAPELVAESAEFLDRLGGMGPLVTPCIAPHAIYTVSEESLRGLAELMQERDAIFNIHLSETENEVQQCLERTGKRPAEYLDSLGALGPLSILAHGVWLGESELELIAERGSTVVTNPCANMKLAVGGALP
jgi:5-methylthioadenosine/S-adenosylhomocysteine deaminase